MAQAPEEEEVTLRIHRFDDVTESQQAALLQDAVPKQTRAANNFWVGVLMSFCREKRIPLDLATCSASDLNQCLAKFYTGLKTKKGGSYQRGSYLSARSAIQRRLAELQRPFNLRKDGAFITSNRLLDASLKKKKAEGQSKPVQHKESISSPDKVRLDEYFSDVLETQDTYKLQSYAWYNIARHFGLRGGEVFALLKVTDLQFCHDENNDEFISLKSDFLTKNSPGGINAREFNTCGRIQDAVQVQAMRRLLGLLNEKQDRLFQRALLGMRKADGPWFANAPLGHNQLSQMMALLSVRAKLSTRYTNHCVRASVVTDLKEAGYANHEVMAITGHRNESSLKSYDRIEKTDRPTKMAATLDGKDKSSPDKSLVALPTPSSSVAPSGAIAPSSSVRPDVSKPLSAMGGFHLSGNAVIQQLTINFTRSETSSSVVPSKQTLQLSQ